MRLHLLLSFLLVLALAACNSGTVVGPEPQPDPDPDPDPIPVEDGRVVVAGYSNTRGSAAATFRVGSTSLFTPVEIFRSEAVKLLVEDPAPGSIAAYAEDAVKQQLAWIDAQGEAVEAIWWQPGMRGQRASVPSDEQLALARSILEALHALVPSAPIFISPMTPYDGHVCANSGAGGPPSSAVIAQDLASRYDYVTVLDAFPALHQSETQDGCHPTDEIYERNAAQLRTMLAAHGINIE